MNSISAKNKGLVFLLLAIIAIGAFIVFGDEETAYIICLCSVATIVLLAASTIVVKKIRKSTEQKIIATSPKTAAKILRAEEHKNKLILQINVLSNSKPYISSIIINKPTNQHLQKYVFGKNITVHIHPKKKHKAIIAEIANERKRFKFPLVDVMIWGSQIAVFGIIGLSSILGGGNRKYHDAAIVVNKQGKEILWEVLFDPPSKVFIRAYDPLKDERLLKHKDKKETELELGTELHISQQNGNAVIYGTGRTPIFDVYDGSSMLKTSSLENFENKHELLNKGIAEIAKASFKHKVLQEDVLEIITNDGNRLYYNIPQDEFYIFEEVAKHRFYQYDTALFNKYQYTFALSFTENSADKYQLYRVESTRKKYAHELDRFAASNNADVEASYTNISYENIIKEDIVLDTIYIEDFPGIEIDGSVFIEYSQSEPIYEKEDKFNFQLLSGNEIMINPHILYTDSTIAIVKFSNSAAKDAQELISGYNKNGEKLFEIEQADLPNIGEMEDDGYIPLRHYEIEITRYKNHIHLFFKKYGSLGIDIKSRSIIWKHE